MIRLKRNEESETKSSKPTSDKIAALRQYVNQVPEEHSHDNNEMDLHFTRVARSLSTC